MPITFSRFTDYFLAVAQHENLHKAADQLCISVSAVHRQIVLAEEQLGISLFERLPHGLKLTLAGEMLYADILRWQKEFKQTCTRFDEIQGLKRGRLDLGLISALSEGFIVDVLAQLQQQYPWLSLSLHTFDSRIMMDKIINNEVDFGFVLDPVAQIQLDVLSFIEIPMGFVMSPTHPLAKNKQLKLSHTLTSHHFMADAPLVIHERVAAMYKKQNIQPTLTTVSNDIRLMLSMLKNNMGIAILSYLDAYSAIKNQELVFIPIRETHIQPLTLALCAGSRRQLSRISHLYIQAFSLEMERMKIQMHEI